MGGSGGYLPFCYYQSCESVFCLLNASFLKEMQRIQRPAIQTAGNDKKRPVGHRYNGRNSKYSKCGLTYEFFFREPFVL